MAGNKKTRKKFVPKPLTLPLVFRQFQAQDNNIKNWSWAALAQLAKGENCIPSYAELAVRINHGLRLAQQVFTEVAVVQMAQTVATLQGIRKRCYESGVWELTKLEIDTIKSGLELVDEMQSSTTRRELNAAVEASQKLGVIG